MRTMARELELGRARALEAERAAAFRETARQVAHELKNPLTPIRFAVDRLRRSAPDDLRESVEVLAVESERSEEHTSELQSRQYLVCRLLLEKKNISPLP